MCCERRDGRQPIEQAAERNTDAQFRFDGAARLHQQHGIGAVIQKRARAVDLHRCDAEQTREDVDQQRRGSSRCARCCLDRCGRRFARGRRCRRRRTHRLCRGSQHPRRHTILNPLERIGWQRYTLSGLDASYARPVDGDAGRPQRRHGFEDGNVAGIGVLWIAARQTLENDAPSGQTRFASGHHGKGVSGSDLEQHAIGPFQEPANAIREPHGLSQVARPIGRILRLLAGNPIPSHVGDERDARCGGTRLAHSVGEGLQDRIHRGRVEGMRGGETAAFQLSARKELLELSDVRRVAGDDASGGAVDDSQRQPIGQQAANLVLDERNSEHRSGRKRVHQRAARGHEAQRTLQREDACQRRRHVLADAVAKHRVRLNAPRHPETRQRVLDDEECRLRVAGLPQLCGGGGFAAGGGEHPWPHVGSEVVGEHRGAGVELVAKRGVRSIQGARHPGVLRSLAREEKRDWRRRIGRLSCLDVPIARTRKRGFRVGKIRCDRRPPVPMRCPAFLQREGDVRQRELRMRLEMLVQPLSHPIERRFALRAERQHMAVVGRRKRWADRRLLEDDVGIGPADAERTDAGAPRRAVRVPALLRRVDAER